MPKPSRPVASCHLGLLCIRWDGLTASGRRCRPVRVEVNGESVAELLAQGVVYFAAPYDKPMRVRLRSGTGIWRRRSAAVVATAVRPNSDGLTVGRVRR